MKYFLSIIIIIISTTSCDNYNNTKKEEPIQILDFSDPEQDTLLMILNNLKTNTPNKFKKPKNKHPNITLELKAHPLVNNKNIIVENNKIKNIYFFKTVYLEKYKLVNDVEGLEFNYTFNSQFNDIEQYIVDSLVNDSDKMNISLELFENNIHVKTISKFDLNKLNSNDIYFDDFIKFIPYAVLNLPAGNHTLSAKIKIRYKNIVKQEFTIENITINKPKTKTAYININYIEVDCKSKDWDYRLIGTTYPDISVKLYLADFMFAKYYAEETQSISSNTKYKIIIGENDNIRILVEDIDILFTDYISSFYLNTKQLNKNEQYIDSIPHENITSCQITYKVE